MSDAKSSRHQELKDYRIGKEIGKGSFATVYKGEHVPSGSGVAIKAVSRVKLSKKLLENLESEISILKTMKHPHIVALLDYRRTSTHFYLAMEYCSLGDLSYFIRDREKISKSLPLVASLFQRYPSQQGLHEDLARHFLKQLASALQFLRQRDLVHRDIKPQNLLLLPPKKSKKEAEEAGYAGQWELPVLKLADFGFARSLPSTSLAETLCGSPLYMAPEILRYEKYNAKADLWSVGAVVYEMVIGKPPFQAANHVDLLKKIQQADDKIAFPSSSNASEEIRKLIRSLLKKSPTERVGFSEFFQNPILREDIPTENKPLDQSNLDEKIFISEYIDGVPTATRLPTPPSGSETGSPAKHESGKDNVERVDRTNSHSPNYSYATSPEGTNLNRPRVNTGSSPDKYPGRAVANNSTPSPNTSLIVDDRKSYRSSNPGSQEHQKQDNSGSKDRREQSPTTTNNQVAIPMNRTNAASASTYYSSSRPSVRDDSLEQEYVVVEKRTVEVNAFADEVAYSPTSAKFSVSPIRAIMQNNMQRDRRMSIGYGSSPTNALTKALSMASARLFGTKVDINGTTTSVSPPQFAQRPIPSTIEVEERILIKELEALATKAKVVNLFAEVKYSQLLPTDPERILSEDASRTTSDEHLLNLDPETCTVVAEEAMVLYVKTLSLLSKAMEKAAGWWDENDSKGASLQLNDVVQWIREKFNESLEKAEYAQDRIEACRNSIAASASHSDRRSMDKSSSITAEKLIFDRALEMSRAAAVNEQVGEDLEGCELSYGTAVWMLEALLVTDKQDELLDDDDRAIVEKFIASISHRLSVLRTRLEAIGKGGHAQTPALPIHFRRRTSSSSSSSSPNKYASRGQITELSSHAIDD
ncbi:serine/threonine protein kinase ATG1 [Sugiyamaella lignohabitans]|uniref:Serine/threonine-protein kinase ATG1 n=1 Tax=Sugiyamaella lignohabitans TaxID=796027 RepID=A0A167DGH7_9ASCO|nr:serine/threonine protein kinase ATG1 [Sugiyamaella lignohabitans]ANB12890.1 serine/threonine protein kinase ATG1 [Sugiyamaella lignohabitans]